MFVCATARISDSPLSSSLRDNAIRWLRRAERPLQGLQFFWSQRYVYGCRISSK
jgi:hypothetical protein